MNEINATQDTNTSPSFINPSSVVVSNRVLYTPSTFARSSLLYLQEIGELQAKTAHRSSRNNLQSFLFFIVVSGAGILTYKSQAYELSKGDCVFIDCLQSYSHATDPLNLWSLQWIHFNGPMLEGVYEKYCERGGKPVFRVEDSNRFSSVWQQLVTLARSDDYIKDMKINEGLNQLLTLLMENSWHPEDRNELPKKKALIVPVKEFLDLNYREKILLDDLEARFHINKYYLTKVFKERYGQSISSYLLNVRITHAKHLLRFTDKSVEEIGLDCGLGEAHYFSARFKEIEGVPPSVYREQW